MCTYKEDKSMKIQHSHIDKLQKLVDMVESNNILSVISAMVDYRKDKYVLVVDTVWVCSEILAYRYIWCEQKLEIIAGCEVIEEKTLKL